MNKDKKTIMDPFILAKIVTLKEKMELSLFNQKSRPSNVGRLELPLSITAHGPRLMCASSKPPPFLRWSRSGLSSTRRAFHVVAWNTLSALLA